VMGIANGMGTVETVSGAVMTPMETGVVVVGVVVVVVGPAAIFTRTLGMNEVAFVETGEEGAVVVAEYGASTETVGVLGVLACIAFIFKADDAGGVNGALPGWSASPKLVSSSSSSSFNSGLIEFSSFKSLHISFQLLFPRAWRAICASRASFNLAFTLLTHLGSIRVLPRFKVSLISFFFAWSAVLNFCNLWRSALSFLIANFCVTRSAAV